MARGQLPGFLRRRRARPIVNVFSRVFTAGEIRRFRAGRTTVGRKVAGDVPVLLLHTVGRRSAEPRTTPLLYHRLGDDGSLLLVAANGGADWDPNWLHNLRATPDVEVTLVEDISSRIPMRAEVLDTDERAAAWPTALAAFPTLAAAQQATRRPIPLVRLRSGWGPWLPRTKDVDP